MNTFEKVIGYDTIKKELMQVVDMVHNKEKYEALGARMPHGILLHGAPGLGKTLIAKCFIDECGLNTYTLRGNKGGDKFVDEITSTFEKAKKNAPSIVFLDDMDKFANEDEEHCDAEEYVAVQAGIDEVKESGVIVLATTNDMRKLPDSLIRSGRFDRMIVVKKPTQKDGAKIIKYYLQNKPLAENVNFDDICKMMSYHSCAQLETLVNEAAILAGYNKREYIETEDLINAVLRIQYDSPDELLQKDADEIHKIAIHEAGHLVVSEVLNPESVGFASVRPSGRSEVSGFIRKCKEEKSVENQIMIDLAGKIATEMYYSDTCAQGCDADLDDAVNLIRDRLTKTGTNGVSFLEFATFKYGSSPRRFDNREAVVHAELERYIYKTRNILLQNKEFLEKNADALAEKETLLFSDIKAIRKSVVGLAAKNDIAFESIGVKG